MKLYCSSCGAANSYTVEKPKFCQKCGTPMGRTQASQSNSPLPESDSDYAENVPSVSKLDIDIVGDFSPRGITLGALSQMPSAPTDSSAKPPKKKAPRVSKKKVLEDFHKEAGTIKPENG